MENIESETKTNTASSAKTIDESTFAGAEPTDEPVLADAESILASEAAEAEKEGEEYADCE